ncbi:MAG: hypothetical protein MUC87_17265 [Bacteroidia bacterium]|jgi:hypothetical protein|nr:hypothetical protein [Bacteroidia bacterium]
MSSNPVYGNTKNQSAALTRRNRMPALLHPDSVAVDERTVIDDLLMAGALSGYLNFYSTDNEINGTWFTFFGKSEPVLLAGIAATNLREIDAQFRTLFDRFRDTDRPEMMNESIRNTFNFIVELLLRVNHWDKHLSRGIYESLHKEVENQITARLAHMLFQLTEIASRINAFGVFNPPLDAAETHFSPRWKLPQSVQDELLLKLQPPSDSGKIVEMLMQGLKRIYDYVFQSFSYLVEHTRSNFEKILPGNGDNRPDMALFLAFLRMIQQTRKQLNGVTQRHLDHYYKNVLHSSLQDYRPDRTFVTFTLHDTETVQLLPAGTRFEAGKDSAGNPLFYASVKPLFINRASIAALHTLFVSRNPDVIAYEGDKELMMAKGIYSSTDPQRNLKGEIQNWWSLTGTDQHDLSQAERTMENARLGFSISSPALFLSEGRRDITITFRLDKGSAEVKRLYAIINDAKQNYGNNESAAEFYLLHKAFIIHITGPEGWIAIPRYAFTVDQEKAEFILRFGLTVNDPSITSAAAAVHGSEYNEQWPVLRMLLNSHDAPAYAYSMLSGMPVNSIRIDTEVSGMKRLSLWNQSGPLAVDKPFQPFGALPAAGAYFMVGNAEAFSKHLTNVQLHLRWYDLPQAGFGKHYELYSGNITNESFTGSLSLLQNGWFQPQPQDQQQVQLFTSLPTEHPDRGIPVSPETHISNIDPRRLGQRATWRVPEADLFYAPETQEGYLRLELISPAGGFGAAEYPALLTDTMMRSGFRKKSLPLPLAPHVPHISSISLSYSASFDSEKAVGENGEPLLHLYRHYPFGTELYQTGTRMHQARLLPVYNEEGYLFIGLENLAPPQPLTLFFQISEESLHPEQAPSPVVWYYLSSNRWRKLSPERILTDSTQNFIMPGIVELDLPADMTNDNTIMRPGLHWLCAAIPNRTAYTNYVKAIYTQAAEVVWQNDGNTVSHLHTPLPSGTIARIENQPASVQEVAQPIASRSGRPPEEHASMYLRVSERLGHRNRAVLPLDYERLVLQEFPDVYLVKCLPNLDAAGTHKPGHVMLVVMPDVERRDDINLLRPKDCYANLKQIADYIKQRCSPHIRVFVRNPHYERVKVVAAVRFKAGLDAGFYLRQLNEDTRRYLSPWLYEAQAEPRLAGEVSRADMAGFLERLPYVDFVTSLSVVVTCDEGGRYELSDTARMMDDNDDTDTIRARHPWSILVTSSRHQFSLLTAELLGDDDDQPLPAIPRSIGNLILSNDFIITGNGD